MGQTKLEAVLALLRERRIELNPPASPDAVRQLEAQYQITLPPEYVSFITTAGNGGILPDSSGLKQRSCYLLPIEQCRLENAARPFPYMEPGEWAGDDAPPEEKSACGHFAFTAPDDGEGYTWDLIVTGPRRGEVWEFSDWKLCRGVSTGFLDWVLDCVGRGFPQDRYVDSEAPAANNLDARLARIEQKLRQKKLKPRPPIPAEQLQEIENRYGIKLPEEYAAFLTKTGNGFAPSEDMPGRFLYPFEHINSARDGIPCAHILLTSEKKRNVPIEHAVFLPVTGAGEIWYSFHYTATSAEHCGPLGGMTFLDWLEKYLSGFSF
ncbi:SMI1/KNR4 family protein [Oscillospiraceae bacterium 38-13]